MMHQFEISCTRCGARGFYGSENNGAIKFYFEKGSPSTMDRVIVYCSKCGYKQESGLSSTTHSGRECRCLECGETGKHLPGCKMLKID